MQLDLLPASKRYDCLIELRDAYTRVFQKWKKFIPTQSSELTDLPQNWPQEPSNGRLVSWNLEESITLKNNWICGRFSFNYFSKLLILIWKKKLLLQSFWKYKWFKTTFPFIIRWMNATQQQIALSDDRLIFANAWKKTRLWMCGKQGWH